MSVTPRIAALEAAIDERLRSVYDLLLPDGSEIDHALLRAAFGVGYVTALKEDPPGAFAREHGYRAAKIETPSAEEPPALPARARKRDSVADNARTMGVEEYFWAYEFRFDLRDAPRAKQEEIRRRFVQAHLKLAGFTKRHIEIVEDVLGRKAIARQDPSAARSMQPPEVELPDEKEAVMEKARSIGFRLDPVGAHLISSLNGMATADARGERLSRHTPSAPYFWFAGLARDIAGQRIGGRNTFLNPKVVALLNRSARARIRRLGIEMAAA